MVFMKSRVASDRHRPSVLRGQQFAIAFYPNVFGNNGSSLLLRVAILYSQSGVVCVTDAGEALVVASNAAPKEI